MTSLLDFTESLEQPQTPAWVSKTNVSHKAFEAIQELEKEKLTTIESAKSALKKKSDYQISVSEIAKRVSVNRVTLGNTASYAADLKAHLKEVNLRLLSVKADTENRAKRTREKGRKAHKKSELLVSNQKLRQQIEALEEKQVTELLELTIDKLPLPVRQALGLI